MTNFSPVVPEEMCGFVTLLKYTEKLPNRAAVEVLLGLLSNWPAEKGVFIPSLPSVLAEPERVLYLCQK